MDLQAKISQIMANVANKTLDQELGSSMIEKLILDEKSKTESSVYYKVSEKGAISIYNTRKSRFPITLYKDQLFAIFNLFLSDGYTLKDDFNAFLEENASKFE